MNPIVRRFVQIGILILVQAIALFGPAGRLNWAEGWAYLGLYLGFIALNAVIMLPGNKELIKERGEVGIGAKGWDRVVGGLAVLLGPGMLIVAGMDERFGWSPQFGLAVQAAAFVVMALGYGMFSWAMASNKFFSAVVRIQKDRGHTVVTGGPYRFVRHPGYIGITVVSLVSPLLLGSVYAFIPAGLMAGMLVVRTALEDSTLQNELEGYKDYAGRVRYRLLPGVW